MDAANLVDKDGFGWVVIGIYDAYRAVVLAEQDAEERMREKAIEAFCMDCICASDGKHCSFGDDCAVKVDFIQKLNEE